MRNDCQVLANTGCRTRAAPMGPRATASHGERGPVYHGILCTWHAAPCYKGRKGSKGKREEVRAGARRDAGERHFQAPGRLGALSGLARAAISEHVCTGYTLLINSVNPGMDEGTSG